MNGGALFIPRDALEALYREYPRTAELLHKRGNVLLQRLPEDERLKWLVFIRDFVETFAVECEAAVVKRTQVDVYDTFTKKP